MDENIQTLDTNPETESLSAPAAEGSQNDVVEQTTTQAALSLDEINLLTKHSYATLDEAKKGIENLRKAVGQKEVKVTDPTLVEQVQTLQREMKETSFYAEHPELKPHKDFLAKLGPDPAEALKDPQVAKVLEVLKSSEAKESSKLTSNSRVAQVNTNYQEDFAQAKATGKWTEFLKKHKGIEIK